MNRRQFGLSSLLTLFGLGAAKASQPTHRTVFAPLIRLNDGSRWPVTWDRLCPMVGWGNFRKWDTVYKHEADIRLGGLGKITGWTLKNNWFCAYAELPNEEADRIESGEACLRAMMLSEENWGKIKGICVYVVPFDCLPVWGKEQKEEFGTKGGTV